MAPAAQHPSTQRCSSVSARLLLFLQKKSTHPKAKKKPNNPLPPSNKKRFPQGITPSLTSQRISLLGSLFRMQPLLWIKAGFLPGV